MSGPFEDRLKAAGRLLHPAVPPGTQFLQLHDPRPVRDIGTDEGDIEARPILDRVVMLAIGGTLRPQSVVWAVQACSKLELALQPQDLRSRWNQAVAIATIKTTLPAVYSDAETSRAIATLLAMRREPGFPMMAPAWQLQALADLAIIASADRATVTDPMLEPLKAFVSDLSLLRRGEAALVEFGGGPADPTLAGSLAALPYGGVSSTASVGRLSWQTPHGECLVWVGPSGLKSPVLEMWHDGRAVLTTAPQQATATALLTDPPLPPHPVRIKRRDDGQAMALEAICDGSHGRLLHQWGRIVRLIRSRDRVEVEDWLLATKPSPTTLPRIAGLQIVCPADLRIESAGPGAMSLSTPAGAVWLLEAQGLRWSVLPADPAVGIVVLTAALPVAERPGARSIKWSVTKQPRA